MNVRTERKTRATPAALPHDHHPEIDESAAPESHHEETTHGFGPDDVLGLYLKQMGAIPLLNREKELELALKNLA